jgi:Flp pilus assembly protein TadG
MQERGRRILARFLADERGNFAAMAAILIPMLLIAVGAATDYTSAARRQETLQGISDAAALAATQPVMMGQSCVVPTSATCANVVAQVDNVFNGQSSTVSGVSSVTITSVNIQDTATQRAATITWTAKSNNLFAGVLGMPTIAIGGTSTAKNGSPVTTFYMLIDTSPSMGFPATASGVTTMIADTPNNTGGCALGCHETDVNGYVDEPMWNPSNVACTGTGYANPSFACVQGQSASIKSGTYTKSTGLVTLTLNATPSATSGIASGLGIWVTGVTGTGSVASVNSPTAGPNFTAGSGTSGATVTYTIAKNLTLTITGNTGSVISMRAAYNAAGPTVGTNISSSVGCATSANNSTAQTSTSSPGSNQTASGSGAVTYFGSEDAFALSRCLDIPLRIDYVNQAVSTLLNPATPADQGGAYLTAIQNHTTYAVELYTLDSNSPSSCLTAGLPTGAPTATNYGLCNIFNWQNAAGSMASPSDIEGQTDATMYTNFTNALTAAGTLDQLIMYKNGCLTSACSGNGSNDQDTALDTSLGTTSTATTDYGGMGGLYWAMPTVPTTSATPTPKEVLFIITDGVNDYYNGSGRKINAVNSATNTPDGVSWCTEIEGVPGSSTTPKGKNIEIAFLYLTYNPLNPNGFYISNVEPFQPDISTDAQTCATPGLYAEVNYGTDIGPALNQLFFKAAQSVYLAH